MVEDAMSQSGVADVLRSYFEILEGRRRPARAGVALRERVAAARGLLSECRLCEHQCGVNRSTGERGVCRVGTELRVASAFDHYGEEPFFVPSFTVFFASCTFRCVFCQNWDISQIERPEIFTAMNEVDLAALIDRHQHCRNVNFVGGEPTPYLPFILGTLVQVTSDIPVVWNSNFYMSEEAMALLDGVVDVYLSDFKFGNDRCARRLSGVPRYGEVVRRNHRLAAAQAPLVIRHLVLPEHLDCCTRPVLEFIAEEFGDRVIVNLMDQYRPCYRATRHPDIDRRLSGGEFAAACETASRLKLCFLT